MNSSHDVFSETNPAFCSYVIAAFVASYSSVKSDGPELACLYVAIPLALSGEFDSLFEGTNKNTGLVEWANRHPVVRIGLASRINESLTIVTEGLRFACFADVLAFTRGARLQVGSQVLKKAPQDRLEKQTRDALKRASRLGFWFATEGSSRSIFETLELTV